MRKGMMVGIIVIISISIFLFAYIITHSNDNFEKQKEDFQSGNYKTYANIADIPEEYYTRPDFYPSYDTYKNKTDKSQPGAYGYGAYPSEVSYNVTGFKAGQYLDVYTFVHSSYDVGNYQGIRLSLKSPANELFETYTEPSDILLSPLSLKSPETTPNWTYRIKMRIIAKKDVPEGRYVFKLSAGQPSAEKQTEYYNMVSNYTSGGLIQPGKFFDFVLYAYK
ncbi:Uncharacterised protein [uncultured archaeon]|nr:Uncharacterised protein [uncultured archaeon]